jgi:hypothetical protein
VALAAVAVLVVLATMVEQLLVMAESLYRHLSLDQP